MTDIAPELIASIQKMFEHEMENDPELAEKLKVVLGGSIHYSDAMDLSDRVGQCLRTALQNELTPGVLPDDTMYYNIAKRLVDDVAGHAYDIAAEAAEQVQGSINSAAGIGLNAVSATSKEERLNGIVDAISGKPIEESVPTLLKAAGQLPLGAAADTMRANVEFQGKAGLQAHIIRKAEHKCCKWCSQMAGVYSYPEVPKDVYRRHENCRCQVEYIADNERRTIHAAGDDAQRRSQEAAKQERLKRYSAMTEEQKKYYDAQVAARKKFVEKQSIAPDLVT